MSPPLTKGTDELLLHSPRHPLHQAEGGERRKAHVVDEDDVEVPQPIKAAKIPQEVEASDSCGQRRGGQEVPPPQTPKPPLQPHFSPSVLEKTGRAELSTSNETQFPMIWGGEEVLPHCSAPQHGSVERGGGSHLGQGGVLPLGEQPSEERGAVETHDGGEHQVTGGGC